MTPYIKRDSTLKKRSHHSLKIVFLLEQPKNIKKNLPRTWWKRILLTQNLLFLLQQCFPFFSLFFPLLSPWAIFLHLEVLLGSEISIGALLSPTVQFMDWTDKDSEPYNLTPKLADTCCRLREKEEEAVSLIWLGLIALKKLQPLVFIHDISLVLRLYEDTPFGAW